MSRNLSILFFGSSHHIGLTDLLTNQAIALRQKVKELHVVTGEKEQYPKLFKKLKDHSIQSDVINGLDEHSHTYQLITALRKIIKRTHPDIIHVHTNWQLMLIATIKFAFFKKFKIIYTIHGYRHNHQLWAIPARVIITSALFLFANKVIAPCQFTRKKFKLINYKIKVLPFGIDPSFIKTKKERKNIIKNSFIFAGEFRKGKAQALLIKTFNRYMKENPASKIKLILPGAGEDLEYCKTLAYELNMTNIVEFPGWLNRDEMLSYYSTTQFAIIPTNIETFGLSIIEPLAVGLIIISRPVGIANEIIQHNKNGFIWDTPNDLLKIITSLLANKHDLKLIQEESLQLKDHFDWAQLTDQYLQIIQEA